MQSDYRTLWAILWALEMFWLGDWWELLLPKPMELRSAPNLETELVHWLEFWLAALTERMLHEMGLVSGAHELDVQSKEQQWKTEIQ